MKKSESIGYNYEDKQNQTEVLFEKRKQYIVKAINEVLKDKNFVKKLTAISEDAALNLFEFRVYQMLLENHRVDDEASVKTLEELGTEYNHFAIEKVIINYIASGEKDKLTNSLKQYI